MKKFKLVYFLIFMIMIFYCNEAKAISVDEFYSRIDNSKFSKYYSNQIVHVDNITFDDNMVDVSGYSFIPYQDNYGGRNIKTYLVASVAPKIASEDGINWYGNGEDWSWNNWGNKTLAINQRSGTLACKDQSKCYLMETEFGDWVRDFWWSRCNGEGCAYQEAVTNERIKNFNNTITCATETIEVNGENIGSNCLYYNVGFSVRFNLNDIINRFSSSSSIEEINMRFFIVTLNTDVLINGKPGIGAVYTEMYVPSENCDYKDIKGNLVSCSSDVVDNDGFMSGRVDTNSFSFGLSYKATSLALNARQATPLTSNYSSVGDDYYFYNKSFDSYLERINDIENAGHLSWFVGETYNIAGYEYGSIKIGRRVNEEKGIIGIYEDSIYQLHTYNLSNCSGVIEKFGGEEVPGMFSGPENSSCAAANWSSNGGWANEDIIYKAPANWVNVRGSFQINGIKVKNKVLCNKLYDDVSSKYYSDEEEKEASLKCEIDNQRDVTLKQCSDNDESGHSVSGTIYVKVDESNSCSGINNDKNGFVSIGVNTSVSLYQKGYFKFNEILRNSIRAGKGFELISSKNDNINNTLIYNSLLEWNYFVWYRSENRMLPFINFTTSYSKNINGSGCKIVNPYELLNNTTEFYINNTLTNNSPTTLDNAVFTAIDNAVKRVYFENGDDVSDAINVNNKIDIYSGNSNLKSTSIQNNNLDRILGQWSLKEKNTGLRYFNFDNSDRVVVSANEGIRSGNAFWHSYFYSLPNAYISLIDNGTYNYGDVLYINGEIDESMKKDFYYVGNKYFVPLKFSGSFPFNLAPYANPSLINVMEWELNGTCSVDVENGLFDDDGKPLYKYRSISLSNPFPKGNTSLNWRNWHLKFGYLDRLENTYDVNNDNTSDENDYIYSFTLLKKYGTNGIEIAEVNSCSSLNMCSKSYGTFDGLGADGISDFVEHYDQWANNQNSYCGLGMFSSRCDAFANGTILDIEGDVEVENGGSNEGVDTPIIISPINPGVEESVT